MSENIDDETSLSKRVGDLEVWMHETLVAQVNTLESFQRRIDLLEERVTYLGKLTRHIQVTPEDQEHARLEWIAEMDKLEWLASKDKDE